MFDCVLPTHLAWQGTAFTSTGRVRITRGAQSLRDVALDAGCACSTCRTFTRSYLHHLFKCSEPLGPRLLSIHNLHYFLQMMREARAAIDAGRYASFARQRLAEIDRHEHAAQVLVSDSPVSDARGDHEIVRTRSGALAIRSLADGEIMHPGVGPLIEAEQLYVRQSRLEDRLRAAGDAQTPPAPPPRTLVVFDVGLGAGSNALAARAASERAPAQAARLDLYSFERDLGALELALANGEAFGWRDEPAEAARALLAHGEHDTARTRWRLIRGDVLEALAHPPAQADIFFWDPFSPRANPALWTVAAFAAARRAASAALHALHVQRVDGDAPGDVAGRLGGRHRRRHRRQAADNRRRRRRHRSGASLDPPVAGAAGAPRRAATARRAPRRRRARRRRAAVPARPAQPARRTRAVVIMKSSRRSQRTSTSKLKSTPASAGARRNSSTAAPPSLRRSTATSWNET